MSKACIMCGGTGTILKWSDRAGTKKAVETCDLCGGTGKESSY